jgi:very-short-patch-repair endonuclease
MQILFAPIIVGLLLGGSLLILALIAAIVIRIFSPAPSLDGLYEPVPALLTEAERSFFGVLLQAVPHDYVLFAKVRLADIIRPSKSLFGRLRYGAINRIWAKHIDFVFCDRRTLRIVGVLELDDRSHQLLSRQQRDRFVDNALTSAGIPILRIPARKFYSVPEIQEHVARVLPVLSSAPVKSLSPP